MSVRRSVFVLFLIVIGLPIIVFQNRIVGDAGLTNLSNFQLYRVGRGDVELTISAIGTIEADQSVRLSFVGGGRVQQLYVKRGDYVLAGDMLAVLDNRTQRLNYEQALLALERAELDLEELLSPPDEETIRLADANIDAAWGAYLSISQAVTLDDIRAAELAYEQALAVYEDTKARRDQAPGGYESDNYILLDAQTGAASFNAEIARLRLEALKTGNAAQLNAAYARVLAAQAEKERLLAGPSALQIQAAETLVQQAEAQLDRARLAYERTFLYAPFDAVVSSVAIEQGALVAPGLAVIELTDLSPLGLTVQVDEVDIGLVDESLASLVTLDALPNVDLRAEIIRIADIGRNDGGVVTYDVAMRLLDEDPRARVGMTAEATIIVERKQNVLVVPNLYVRLDRRANVAYVNVLRDNRIEEVEVQLGLRGQDMSEVLAGLQEGDLIAIGLTANGFTSFLED